MLWIKPSRPPSWHYGTTSRPGPSDPLPVVSLEEFFTGNDDPNGIGVNTDNGGPEHFRDPLFAIRARPDVQDVLLEISDIEHDNESLWPFCERVYILTSASASEVEAWLAQLHPDSVDEDWAMGAPTGAPSLQPGVHLWAAWWD